MPESLLPERIRHFNVCLWCGEDLVAKKITHRGNYYCGEDCYRKSALVLRMALGDRKSGGKSGIQAMLLGLLLTTLQRHPDGLHGKDMISITTHDYSDYGKLMNARKIAPWFRIYLNKDVWSIEHPSRGVAIYHLHKGTCLKDWLKPKYREYLETCKHSTRKKTTP